MNGNYTNGQILGINFDNYLCNYQNLLVLILLQFRNDVKMYHWQTKLFNRHKISDELLDSIDKLSDKIIETLFGRLNTRPFLKDDKIVIRNIDDNLFVSILKYNRDILEKILDKISFISFKSLIDELLVEINKTLYLTSFN